MVKHIQGNYAYTGRITGFLRLFFYWRGNGHCISFIYSKITPHNEWQLIKNNNTAASLAFSGTLLGYVIPLSSAAINSVSIPDYFAWGGIALVIQLLIYGCVRLYMPTLSEKIIHHNVAAGLFMGTAALAGGIFNAACMTW
ncbi:inner membrane protein [Salmonella enterica subsp. enterica serovar Heidelberg str. 92-0138]|nr:inner membrane protein [Salmonella enterica subsp. enterica serovar Heidelberg str. 92-0138]